MGVESGIVKERPKPPRHAFEVVISIGGDSWEYVRRTMSELEEHIQSHGPDCNMCSGGAGGCHSISIAKREVTPEQYGLELEEWRKKLGECDGR